jgi:hypothetical protein
VGFAAWGILCGFSHHSHAHAFRANHASPGDKASGKKKAAGFPLPPFFAE